MKKLQFAFEDVIFDRLEKIKNASGLTWERAIIKALIMMGIKQRQK